MYSQSSLRYIAKLLLRNVLYPFFYLFIYLNLFHNDVTTVNLSVRELKTMQIFVNTFVASVDNCKGAATRNFMFARRYEYEI